MESEALATKEQDRLSLLVRAVQELSLARSIERVTEIVRKAARRLADSDGATFVLKDRDMCYYVDEEAIGPLWKGQRFPMSACISGWCMMHKQQVIIEDIYQDDRIPIDAYRPTFVRSLLMVPIRTLDPIGAIGNYWAKHHVPDEEEIRLLQSLADITAVTLENVKVYNELEQRVEDRTSELQAANKDLEAFSYTISHDLHAPLRAIFNYLNIIRNDYQEKVLDEEALRMMDRVLANATEMRQLIDGLLEFFRTGKKELQLEVVDMHAMVQEAAKQVQESFPQRALKLIIHPLPEVTGEASLLKQVWMNLLSNAVKYSGRKPQTEIEVGAENKQEEVIFYVKDNGAGFNMEQYERLFGVFQRLHSKQEFEGTGIGLATVDKIISRHKGKVWAEGKVDEGATFYFSLPV